MSDSSIHIGLSEDWFEEFRRELSLSSDELFSGNKWLDYHRLLSEDLGRDTFSTLDWLSINDFSTLLSSINNKEFNAKKPELQYFDLQSEPLIKVASPDSTKTEDINAINKAYRAKLFDETESFVYELVRTDFEDGMENSLTEEIRGYIQENAFATYSWLNHIYADSQDNDNIIAGLLRIIAMDVEEEDYDDLLPIVKAGLCDYGTKVQEAALMVIEKWRTKNCLIALKTANIQSRWIREYANKVKAELINELNYVD